MASPTSTLQLNGIGKLILISSPTAIDPILSNDRVAVVAGIGYIANQDISANDSTTGHGTPPLPGPNTTTGHGTPPLPGPNSTTGHGTPPLPGPNLTTTLTDYPTIGQIMAFGGIRSTTQLAFQVQAHAGQKMPQSFAVQVLTANNQVVYQTDMTSFHGQNLGDKIVLGFDTEAAQEAANYFGLQNYLRVVTKTADDMNKIQSVIIGKRSNQ